MPTKTNLRIDWATHEAAKYACENWHYSRGMTGGNLVKVGVWEGGVFKGVIIFGRGPNNHIGQTFGLNQFECVELVRVALRDHVHPVSRMMSLALKFLKMHNSGLKLVVSYADIDQNHHGGIYQATNWIYVGTTNPDKQLKVFGKIQHRKKIYDKYGTQSVGWLRKNVDPLIEEIRDSGKHKYLMPLDDEMRAKIAPLAKPYPKRAGSKDNVASGFQSEEGGAIPTPALQNTDK